MIDARNTFFISDPHFDHINILRYANRPFKTIEEMNEAILRNYNEVVRDDSLVFFLGDMAFGRGARTAKWWLSQLRGNIIYVKGSHDHGIRPTNRENCYLTYVLETEFGKVTLTHEPLPNPHPKENNQWQIHGHTHDTCLVHMFYKRVCVCVEAINYRPISLQQIREAIHVKSSKKAVSEVWG